MREGARSSEEAVAILCPSLGKACGIARYSTYVADALRKTGRRVSLIRRSSELFRPGAPASGAVLVQHEYGLFDALSPLGTGETTGELLHNLARYAGSSGGAQAAIVMHTVATHDHVLNAMNSLLFSSSVPIFHLNSTGCYDLGIPYLEHGVYAYPRPSGPEPAWKAAGEIPKVMGSFGLLSPNKRPNQLIDICARSGSDLLGNFATADKALVNAVLQTARSQGVKAEIHSDFCSEAELVERLGGATFAAVAQEAIAHSATSGSLRFLFNLGIPVIAPYVPQFADCEDGVIFAHADRMHHTIQALTSDHGLYREAAQRAERFLERNEMGAVYARLIDLLRATPARELVAYRQRNFRELNADSPLLTPADACIRAIGAEDPGGEEAAEAILARALCDEAPAAAEALLHRVPERGPVELQIGLDRVASRLMQPRDRAALIGSERFIARNLRKVGEHLSVDDTVEARAREELARLVRAAVDEKSELLERRDAVRLLSGSILHALKPDLYPADIGPVADRLRALAAAFGDRRGFTRRTGSVASAPVLLALPAQQVLSYLLHVGGLHPEEVLSLVGTLGLPGDGLTERVEWVRGLEGAYPRREGVRLSLWRPDPRDLRGRSRFFRTEFACLTDQEFAAAAWEVFHLRCLSGPDLGRLRGSLRRDGRRAALRKLCFELAGAYDIQIVDALDDAPNVLDRVDRIAAAHQPQDDMLRVFLQPTAFEYRNRAEKAEAIDWLADVGPNDLFITRTEGTVPKAPVYLVPASFEALLLDRSPAEAGSGAGRARSLLAPPEGEDRVRREAWSVSSSDGWSHYRKAALSAAAHAALPDEKWEEAWSAVARHSAGKAIGPEEMRAVSARVVPMHVAAGIADFDFVIFHKGRAGEYAGILAEMRRNVWHITYANEVFLVFARRVYPTEAYHPRYVPKRFLSYVRLANVGWSALLVRMKRRATAR